MLTDTHPDANNVQVALLCRMTPAERFAKAASLTATVVSLSRQAIARQNPDLDRQSLNIKCVALYYGKDVAKRLHEYLEKRQTDAAI